MYYTECFSVHTHTHIHAVNMNVLVQLSPTYKLKTSNQSMHAFVYFCGQTKGLMANNCVELTLHTQRCILLFTFDWYQICKV